MKKMIAKVLLGVFVCLLAGIIIQVAAAAPAPVFGAAPAGSWGDSFENDRGQTICVCSDENDCYPCVILPN